MISVGQRERNIGEEGKDGGRFDGGDKSRWTQLKFEMSEIMHFTQSYVVSEHVPPLKNAFLAIVCCFRAGTCSENIWTLNFLHVFVT